MKINTNIFLQMVQDYNPENPDIIEIGNENYDRNKIIGHLRRLGKDKELVEVDLADDALCIDHQHSGVCSYFFPI